MPELPEVETTRRGIAPHVTGKTVTSMTVRERRLRWPVPDCLDEAVTGSTLRAIHRRSKYLLLQFDRGTAIWHLGMSGSLRLVPRDQPLLKHDHIDWVFDEEWVLRYHDPRRFGALLWTEQAADTHPLLRHLGPEPLSEEFHGAYLYARSRGRSAPLKAWLMDAKTVVGVGNIYANEALFASALHPLQAAARLTRPKCARLAEAIKKVLSDAIAQGGTTLRDYVGGDGQPGYFALDLKVYGRGREPCPICDKPLTEKRLSQRTTVFCTKCQK